MIKIKEKINPEINNLRMSGEEFRFVRAYSGLTMEQFADFIGFRTRSAIHYWEKQEMMKPYQVDLLRRAVSADVWFECRRLWRERENE